MAAPAPERPSVETLLSRFVDELAAPAPAPTGGAAAAAAAAMASGLVVMVAQGSPRWSAGPGVAARATSLRARLLRLADEDVAAVTELLRALRDARRPAAERDELALPRALVTAAGPPQAIAESALEVAELAGVAAVEGAPAMRADAAVAASLAMAAADSGVLVVEANLAGGAGGATGDDASELALAAHALRERLADVRATRERSRR